MINRNIMQTIRCHCLALTAIFLLMVASCNNRADQTDKPQSQSLKSNKIKTEMKQVLIIGMDPKTVDFSKPGFEKGLTAEIVAANIKTQLRNINDNGYKTDILFLYPDSINLKEISKKLKSSPWGAVLIGYGIRMSPDNFSIFEKLINQIHTDLPTAKIIFNNDSKGSDMLESIQRWI